VCESELARHTLSAKLIRMSTRSSTKVIHTSLGLPSAHGGESAAVAGLWIWNAGHEDVIVIDSDEETNWNSLRSSSIRTNTGHGTLQEFSDFEEEDDDSDPLEGSFHYEIADVPFKMDANANATKLERRMSADRSMTKSVDTCSRSIDTFAYDDDIVATFDDGANADEVIEAVSTVAYKQGHRRTFQDQREKLAMTIASELCSRASEDSLSSLPSFDDHNAVHEYDLPDDDLKPPPAPQEDETSASDSDYLHSPASMSKYVIRMARSPKKPNQANNDLDDSSEDRQPRVEESGSEADSLEEPSQELSLDQKPAAVELSDITSKCMELPELSSYESNDMEQEETQKPRPPNLSSVEDESQILLSKSSSYEEIVVTSSDNDEGRDDSDSDSMMSSVFLSLPEDQVEEDPNDGSYLLTASSYMEITVDDSRVTSDYMEMTVDDSLRASQQDMGVTVDDSGRTGASRDTAGDDAREELIALLQKVKSDIVNGIQRGANHGTITLDEHISHHHDSVVDDMNTDDCLQSMDSSEAPGSCFSLTFRPGLTKQISGLTTHSFSKRSTLAENSISITGTARTVGSSVSIAWKKVVPKPRMNSPGRRQSTTIKPQKHKSPPWSTQGLYAVSEGYNEGVTRTRNSTRNSAPDLSKDSRRKAPLTRTRNSAPDLLRESRKKAPRRRSYSNVAKHPHDFIRGDPKAVWSKVKAKKRLNTRRSRQWKSEGHVKVSNDIRLKRNTRPASVPDLTVAFSDMARSDVDQEETKRHPDFYRSPSSMKIQGLLPSKHNRYESLNDESCQTELIDGTGHLTEQTEAVTRSSSNSNSNSNTRRPSRSPSQDRNCCGRRSRSRDKRQEKKAKKLEALNTMMGQTVGVQRSPGSDSSSIESKERKKISLSEKHQEVNNLREKLSQSFGNVIKGSRQKLREAFTKSKSSRSIPL
jgi:hypothetical protein